MEQYDAKAKLTDNAPAAEPWHKVCTTTVWVSARTRACCKASSTDCHKIPSNAELTVASCTCVREACYTNRSIDRPDHSPDHSQPILSYQPALACSVNTACPGINALLPALACRRDPPSHVGRVCCVVIRYPLVLS